MPTTAPRATRFAVIVGGGLLTVWLASLAFHPGGAQESRYTNYAEAQQSQHRNRLPAVLPMSATEIHEWHDDHAHVSFGSFHFDPRERPAIERTLAVGLRVPIRIDRDPSFATDVPRDPSEGQLGSIGFEFYTAQDFAFAVRWRDGMAYYWHAHAGQ